MRLGGWQRLWVVFSCVWLLVVGFFIFLVMPQIGARETFECYETHRLISASETSGDKSRTLEELRKLRSEIRSEIRRRHCAGKNRDELRSEIRRAQELHGERIDFGNMESKWQAQITERRRAQAKSVIAGLSVWVASIAIVYVIGWAIGWVTRGFRG